MRTSRIIAAATGVMIGFGVIAPVATATPPTSVAGNGHGWGVQEAQREFRADVREARQEFRAQTREARQEFRRDLRQIRLEHRARFHEARQDLREALQAAREAFRAAIQQANEAFRAGVADSREALLAVLQDPASTSEQRMAAWDAYEQQVRQAREVRHDAVKDAITDYRAARAAAFEAFRAAIGK